MKKKIVFFMTTMHIGGIEKALIELLNNIDYERYDVTLFLEKDEGELLDFINKKVHVKNYNICESKFVLYRKIMNGFKRLKFILLNRNKYAFSCCYATYSKPCSLLSLLASKNNCIYVHGDYVTEFNDNSKTISFFENQDIYKFKKIIFVSNESKENLVKIIPDIKNKSIVMNNFINYNKIIKLSREKISETIDNRKTLIFVGRLDEKVKKVSRLINAVHYCKMNNLDIRLLIVGDGEYFEYYKTLIKNKKLEKNVKMFGLQENPYPYIKLSDYVCITSEHEGFPVIFLETLVLNKKILSTVKVSDEFIDISKYGFILSKDQNIFNKQIYDILMSDNGAYKKIDFEKLLNIRRKNLEKLIEGE